MNLPSTPHPHYEPPELSRVFEARLRALFAETLAAYRAEQLTYAEACDELRACGAYEAEIAAYLPLGPAPGRVIDMEV